MSCRESKPVVQLSTYEKMLNDFMIQHEAYSPVMYDEEKILGETLKVEKRYKFIKSMSISRGLDVLRYDPGGGASAVTVLWWVPDGESSSEHATNIVCVSNSVENRLPVYHTRQMRRDFYQKYGGLQGMSPVVLRSIYFDITGDATQMKASKAVDERMRLYLLGELPEVAVDLRHVNTGRPEVYNDFFALAEQVIQDWIAEDDRRHGVAHLSKFMSIRDLHEEVKQRCQPGTLIPSMEWLRLQFLPTNPRAASAIHYTGCLEVKFAVQSRVLLRNHEDDHYAAAVFKYLRAMAVDLVCTKPVFACMDDKAKIPIGEPGEPTSTSVRTRPTLALKGHVPTAMDHDHTRGSFTPSVILFSQIPCEEGGSFYHGQVDVRLKDSVFTRSNPFLHAAELSSSMAHDDLHPSVVFVYTDGGSDHRFTLKSVQLSLIALFLVNDLDLLVAAHTCPGHSFANPAERVMATLNLGLQNAAFARVSMPAASEAAIKSCMSMADIRNAAGKSSELKTHWEKSIDPARSCISQRFNRLLHCNKQIRVLDEVPDENMQKAISSM